jgi:site-specific DNA-cytosine methylase
VKERVYTILYPFCGIGGGALGQKASRAKLLGVEARFRVIGGIDFDQAACNDFEHLVGAPALCRDIAHLSAHELRQLCPDAPDAVFLSPPCKGASGLLSAEKAKTAKYEAMNSLALDWIETMLEAWGEPPKLVLLENVPRLKQRAGGMLKKIRSLLRAAGYVFHDGFHDCGELGGLAQVRKRYLLVARHAKRCPPLLYQPPKLRVRGCGEVLGKLPMPGDPAAGPMHRLPRLSWLNWVRLALIPAGGDWRDLEGVLKDGQPRREVFRRHKVQRWGDAADTVAGSGSNGPSAVADPRPTSLGEHWNKMRVEAWEKPAHTVTGSDRVGSGAPSVADPRGKEWFGNVLRVKGWQEPAASVTGQGGPTNGGGVVADPRIIPQAGAFDHGYGVLHWNEPSSVIAGGSQVGQGAYSVADLRVDKTFGGGAFGVVPWSEPSGTVAGEAHPSNGKFSVADVRGFTGEYYNGTYGVLGWEEAAGTITGNARHDTGRFTIADPRKPPPFTPFIIAADGTWHRPITTLECGALQSFLEYVTPAEFVLSGSSHSAWRERIGNAVPPKAAESIGDRMLYTLLAAELGGFALEGNLDVWVDPPSAEVHA